MSEIIDISLQLNESLPRWPGASDFLVEQNLLLSSGDLCNNSRAELELHNGTHIDAPWHMVDHGKKVDQIPLSTLVGPAEVVELTEVKRITADVLEKHVSKHMVDRLLLKTSNSHLYKQHGSSFYEEYAALESTGAQWVVDHGIQLIGIDYLSIEVFDSHDYSAHKILLGNEVVVLEGINLAEVHPGRYELTCLPLRFTGTDGAPCRAILRKINH